MKPVAALVWLAATLTGCMEELQNAQEVDIPSEEICFAASSRQMTKAAEKYCFEYLSAEEQNLELLPDKAGTRSAPITDLDNLEAEVTAYIYDTWTSDLDPWTGLTSKKFIFDGIILKSEEENILWKDALEETGNTMKVYAAYPFGLDWSVESDSGEPVISYATGSTDPKQQKEILTAVNSVDRANWKTAIPLTFRHSLTAIRFKAGFDCKIESVTLKGVFSSGDLIVSTNAWTNVSEKKDYVLDFGAGKDFKDGELLNDDEDIYMLIPQILPSEASLVLKYDGGKELSSDLSGVKWDSGKLITYTLHKTTQHSDVVYFDLEAGNVSITPSGYSGYIYVGGAVQKVSGSHDNETEYYVYQSSEAQTETDKDNTGWATAINIGKCRIPEYERVSFGGKSWSEYITDNQVVEDVIENWDNKAGTAGAVRDVGRDSTRHYIHIGGTLRCNLTIDNLYSTYHDSKGTSRTTGGLGFIPTGNNSILTINMVGDNRFGSVHYSNTDSTNGNQIIFSGAGSLTAADADFVKKSAHNDGNAGDYTPGYYSNHWCAAIGNNDSSDHTYGIVFESGVIYAGTTKAENCSAIGGGGNGHTSITIKGGDITAVATTTGTAIGGGIGFNSRGGKGNVTITGGNVYAYNFANRWDIPSSAIGGAGSKAQYGSEGRVTITGGNVYAQSSIGTAIGGGSSYTMQGGDAIITISGGNVIAKSISAESSLKPGTIISGGVGIGGGTGCTSGNTKDKNGGKATVTISGDPIIRTGSIGGGHTNSPGGHLGFATIKISGGDTQAQFIMEPTGSGLATDKPSFVMTGGTIRNSHVNDPDFIHVKSEGGAVYMEDGTFDMSAGNILNCSAEYGGAVYIKGQNSPTFTMTGGEIISCTSQVHGGAIYLEDGNVNIGGTARITGCESNKGGAVYILKTTENIPEFKMTAGEISNCRAVSDGGAVYLEGGSVLISGGAIDDNLAFGGNGGGICILAGDFTMPENGTADISHNSSLINEAKGGNGGGIYVASTDSDVSVSLLSGDIIDNSADKVGGGICVDMSGSLSAKATVTVGVPSGEDNQPMVSDNKAILQGAGLYVKGENANIEINSGSIINNRTSSYVDNEDVANELGMVTLNGGNVTHVVVTFHGNGGYLDGLETTYQNIVTATNSILVQPASINRTGYTFAGWHTRADGDDAKGQAYSDGDIMNLTSDIDLYAQWTR